MSSSYSLATKDFKTILDFLRFGLSSANSAKLYYGHGTDNSYDEILALILGSLNLPYELDPVMYNSQLTPDEKVLIAEQLYKRIVKHVPVPYLTNTAYFCDLSFFVDDRVLIPRSPIAELILDKFSPWIDEDKVESILDLCTGSGCIAIACCYAFEDALVDAVDISKDAISVAVINRDRHSLNNVLTIIESDCFNAVPLKKYDIIVSNPPYVGHEEMQTLPNEYLHEPNIALETNNNGLAIVDNILSKAQNYLSDHGILVVEVGNSEEALLEAYPSIPFTWLDFERGGSGVFILTCQQLKDYNSK